MPKIGAHVSSSVSLDLSLERASHLGAECSQIFISPPRQWSQIDHPREEIESYLKKAQELNISPNFIHGTYLINLGTSNPEHLLRSIDWLIYSLKTADKLKSQGTIFHPGSHKGLGFNQVLKQIIESLIKILEATPQTTQLILENSVGNGGSIGSFEEFAQIKEAIPNPRLKFCLDTQHSFAAGFDWREKDVLEKFIKMFDQSIGWEHLVAIHCNDSKVELGAKRDRHENIGEGFIGNEGFRNFLNNPKFSNLPFILEVPGFGGDGPDQENIKILKNLLSNH